MPSLMYVIANMFFYISCIVALSMFSFTLLTIINKHSDNSEALSNLFRAYTNSKKTSYVMILFIFVISVKQFNISGTDSMNLISYILKKYFFVSIFMLIGFVFLKKMRKIRNPQNYKISSEISKVIFQSFLSGLLCLSLSILTTSNENAILKNSNPSILDTRKTSNNSNHDELKVDIPQNNPIFEINVDSMGKIQCNSEISFYGNVDNYNGNQDDPNDIKNYICFNGDGDYISCGTGLNFTENFSFITLLKCDDIDKEYSAFFAKYETNHYGPYAFSIRQGHVNIWTSYENGVKNEMESKTTIENGEWYHIAIIKENMNLKLFINGILENETILGNVSYNSDLVTIGRQALMFEPYDQLQFTGAIANISIYDYALSEEELVDKQNKYIHLY